MKIINKRKGEKGKGGIKIGIALTAIMVISVFAAMVSPVAAINYAMGKSTLIEEGGDEDNSLQYKRGDTVYYRMSFRPTSEPCNITLAKDVFPAGPDEDLLAPDTYKELAQNEQVVWETSWIIPMDWPSDNFTNYLQIEGLDNDSVFFEATAPKTAFIFEGEPPEFNFTWGQICCLNMEFNGSASYDPDGTITNHTWDFGDGNETTIDEEPGIIQHNYSTALGSTGCGWKAVTLSGYDDQGNYNYTTKNVYVDCGPTAIERANPRCFEEGGTEITFDSMASHEDLSNPDPRGITWRKWTFSDEPGVSNYSAAVTRWVTDTITATLEVSDGCCNDTTTVLVGPCPSRVPAITPIGLIALIGLVSVIAVISIRRRK